MYIFVGVKVELEFRNVTEMNPMYQYENKIFVEIQCIGNSRDCPPLAKMRDDFASKMIFFLILTFEIHI